MFDSVDVKTEAVTVLRQLYASSSQPVSIMSFNCTLHHVPLSHKFCYFPVQSRNVFFLRYHKMMSAAWTCTCIMYSVSRTPYDIF